MSVLVACDQCGRQYSAAEGLLGKRVPCAQCGATILVQANAPPNAAAPNFTSGSSANGPTDKQFRLVAAVGIPMVLLGMLLALFAMRDVTLGAVFIVALGPFAVFYGIAALIDPNIVRAAGKFGTHLPARYKMIAFGVGFAALVCSLGLALLVWSRLTPGM